MASVRRSSWAWTGLVSLLVAAAGCKEDACKGEAPSFQLDVTMDPARAPEAKSLVVELSFGQERRTTVIDPGSELADGETSVAIDLSDLAPSEAFDVTVALTAHPAPSGMGAPLARGERTASLSPDGCNRLDVDLGAAPPADAGPEDTGIPDAETGDAGEMDAEGMDADGMDAEAVDGAEDAGVPDAEPQDGGPDAGACPAGCEADCAQDCSAAACTCAGCPCDLTCPTGTCNTTCSQSSMCTYTATAATDNTVTCQNNAECTIQAEQANTVSVTCRNTSQCDITCDRTASCDVACTQGAQCVLRCVDPAGTCEFSSCGGTEMSCPTGEIVCNRACP